MEPMPGMSPCDTLLFQKSVLEAELAALQSFRAAYMAMVTSMDSQIAFKQAAIAQNLVDLSDNNCPIP